MSDTFKSQLANLAVLVLFLVFVIGPGILPQRFDPGLTSTHYGVLHLASLCFIVGSFMIYVMLGGTKVEGSRRLSNKRPVTLKQLRDAHQSLEQVTQRHANKSELLVAVTQLPLNNRVVEGVVGCIAKGYGAEVVTQSIAKLTEDLQHNLSNKVRFWGQLSAVLPLLGMTGTIAGLMFMFQGGADEDQINLSALSTALLTTLYASLITVLLSKTAFKSANDKLAQARHLSGQVARNGQFLVGIVSPHDYVTASGQVGS